jgi:hypothetical protein
MPKRRHVDRLDARWCVLYRFMMMDLNGLCWHDAAATEPAKAGQERWTEVLQLWCARHCWTIACCPAQQPVRIVTGKLQLCAVPSSEVAQTGVGTPHDMGYSGRWTSVKHTQFTRQPDNWPLQ